MAVGALKSNAIGPRRHGPSLGLASTAWGEGVEAAAQTFKLGAPLINSSGRLAIGLADLMTGIIGFAAGAASGVTDAKISYWVATGGQVFEATLEDQAIEDHALVRADMFSKKALQVDSNGVWYIDENDGVNKSVVIVGFRDAIGTVRARVYFIVLASAMISET